MTSVHLSIHSLTRMSTNLSVATVANRFVVLAHVPQPHDLECYADAMRAASGGGELPTLSGERSRLAAALRDAVLDTMDSEDVGILRRLEEMQQSTVALVRRVGEMARLREDLRAEITALEDSLPAGLGSVTCSESSVVANLRGVLTMVLGSVCGGTPIHPAELPAVIKAVTAALAPDDDGATPTVAALRLAVRNVVGCDGDGDAIE